MDITLNYTNLAQVVDRRLSIVGKRSTDDNGKRIFEDITLGTREKGLIDDFIRQAVIDIATETAAFISQSSDTQITLTFPDNHNTQLDHFIQTGCESYCVSFVLWSWFTVTAPRIADINKENCTRQLSSIVRLIHEKKAPEAPDGVTPVDIYTEIS